MQSTILYCYSTLLALQNEIWFLRVYARVIQLDTSDNASQSLEFFSIILKLNSNVQFKVTRLRGKCLNCRIIRPLCTIQIVSRKYEKRHLCNL